jgi:hypothetical protein
VWHLGGTFYEEQRGWPLERPFSEEQRGGWKLGGTFLQSASSSVENTHLDLKKKVYEHISFLILNGNEETHTAFNI